MADKHPSAAQPDDVWTQEVEKNNGLTLVDFWRRGRPVQGIVRSSSSSRRNMMGGVKVPSWIPTQPRTTAAQCAVHSRRAAGSRRGAVETVVGAVPKPYLVEKIERHLK